MENKYLACCFSGLSFFALSEPGRNFNFPQRATDIYEQFTGLVNSEDRKNISKKSLIVETNNWSLFQRGQGANNIIILVIFSSMFASLSCGHHVIIALTQMTLVTMISSGTRDYQSIFAMIIVLTSANTSW